MNSFLPALVALLAVAMLVACVYAANRALAGGGTDRVDPFLSGHEPVTHAVSRFHVRWYAVAMLFLAFDMEMVFRYPWVRIVSSVGTTAVVEMFVFLGILLAGVLYAWREGALRWS